MPNFHKFLTAASCTAMLVAQASYAQEENADTEGSDQVEAKEEIDPGQVIATVNDKEITLAHVIAMRAKLPQRYSQFPDDLLLQAIVDQLVQQTLLMQAFEGDPTLGTQVAIENETRTMIAAEAMREATRKAPSEEVLKEIYEEQYPDESSETEYRAAHILVETEDEAKAIVTELEEGADFAELARERSTGPSGEAGGDLGWFGDGDMVPEFYAGVVALEPDEFSPPIQTQFGWHVIKLSETRPKERPNFEELRPQLEEQARQQALDDYVNDLREKAEVTQIDINAMDPSIISRFEILDQ